MQQVNGKVMNPNLADYKLLHGTEAPEIISC
jgi:hypothetical protein